MPKYLPHLIALSLWFWGINGAAQAQQLFQCPIGAKLLQVDMQGGLVTYAFGPKGAPDLQISAAPADLGYLPWNGIGTEMPEAVQFQSGDYTYEVWYSVRKMMDESEPLPPPAGGVRVLQGDDLVANLVCSAPPDIYDLYLIYEAKLAAGQCYNWESQSWAAVCSG